MATPDVTVEILKDIRDEIPNANRRLDSFESSVTHRLGNVETTSSRRLGSVETTLNQRLSAIETTLLDLAQQQRFVVRYTKAISERDSRLETRVSVLEARVDDIEST